MYKVCCVREKAHVKVMALPCVREKAHDKPMTLPLCQKRTQHTKRHMAEHTKKPSLPAEVRRKKLLLCRVLKKADSEA
jgi:hypothetical protein